MKKRFVEKKLGELEPGDEFYLSDLGVNLRIKARNRVDPGSDRHFYYDPEDHSVRERGGRERVYVEVDVLTFWDLDVGEYFAWANASGTPSKKMSRTTFIGFGHSSVGVDKNDHQGVIRLRIEEVEG